MTRLRRTTLAVAVLVLGLAGCGGDEAPEPQAADDGAVATVETSAATSPQSTEEAPTQPDGSAEASDAMLALRPSGEAGLRVPATRARIVSKQSAFGRVLFDANGQVVYVFENDRGDRSNCTSADCVKAWPPVLTREPPTAGTGVEGRLLGTTRRSNGTLQVTYDGRPLYFYEHEAPGEIRCHNVDLHGGLWWVVTPEGDPAA